MGSCQLEEGQGKLGASAQTFSIIFSANDWDLYSVSSSCGMRIWITGWIRIEALLAQSGSRITLHEPRFGSGSNLSAAAFGPTPISV